MWLLGGEVKHSPFGLFVRGRLHTQRGYAVDVRDIYHGIPYDQVPRDDPWRSRGHMNWRLCVWGVPPGLG